jgi:hypothetical protein
MSLSFGRISLGLVLVFAAGFASGALSDRLYSARTVEADNSRPQQFRNRYLDEMTQRLQLDAGQRKQVEQIMEESRRQYSQLREQYRPSMKKIHDEQAQQVRGLLRQPQAAEYEKMEREREERLQQKEKSGGA